MLTSTAKKIMFGMPMTGTTGLGTKDRLLHWTMNGNKLPVTLCKCEKHIFFVPRRSVRGILGYLHKSNQVGCYDLQYTARFQRK